VNQPPDQRRADAYLETAFRAPQSQGELPGLTEGEIIVIRSTRRKRNIAAYRQGGRIVVSIPARLSKSDERSVVPEMVAKIRAQEARFSDQSVLASRIDALLSTLAPEVNERPISVNWRKMQERWGSCTSVDGTVRISDRLQRAPKNVLDFVLFHEAIHLRYGDHGRDFQVLLARFPERERAQAYLDGYEAAEDALRPPNLPLLPD
jgi:predicted metal-dependent hydrolase